MIRTQKSKRERIAGKAAAVAAVLALNIALAAFGMERTKSPAQSEAVLTENRYSLAGAGADETGPPGETTPGETSPEGKQVPRSGPSSENPRTPGNENSSENPQTPGSGSSSENPQTPGSESSSENPQAPGSEGSSENSELSESEASSENTQPSESEASSESTQPSESEASSENTQPSESEASSENTQPSESEASSENTQPSESEASSENTQPSESEASSEHTQTPGSEPSSESEKPKWPQGYYAVRVSDIAAVIPEGGRIYDGTDRIELTYQTQISRIPKKAGRKDDTDGQEEEGASEEKVPEYHVEYSAHLESADAGERKVVYRFQLQTPCPEHVTLEAPHPELVVTVKKAVLSIDISNGTKMYGDSAEPENIHFERDPVIRVSGFVRDPSGHEIIPDGFELPRPAVDPSVLDRWSPIYDPSGAGSGRVREYRNAVILKTDPQGKVTGNPTGNYEFCLNPADERFHGGTVTIQRAPVKRDVSYEVKGEKGAFTIDENGAVIVRSGTSLRVEPCSGQGYNTGRRFSGITGDSSFTFRLEQRGADGRLLADSLQETIMCRADDSAPEAQIKIMGASSSGGLLFSASSASASVTVPDDSLSGLSRIRYRVLSAPLSSQIVHSAMQGAVSALTTASEWKEISQTGTVSLNGEGVFAVEVEVRDQVGNVSLQRSAPAVIDTTGPGIEITGVEDGSANASAVRIKAQCLDPSYLAGSLKAELKGDFGGAAPDSSVSGESEGGALLVFEDFERRRDADALYHLTVTASDRAGNRTKKQISFSVNRFGSTYGLSDRTASMLKKFYHTRPFDVTFLETNLDKVGNARVLLRAGESMNELHPGPDLLVKEARTSRGTSQYSYTVPASSFKKDGTYEVMLLTTDRAGNSSDTSAQRLPVRFAIDTVSPECLVSGIRPEGRYKEKELTAVIEVRDSQSLDKADVYVDSGKVPGLKGERSGNSSEVIKIPLSEKEAWQTVQVHASDKAGNEVWSTEIPVYISSKDPMKAENYRKNRLSAQQVELIKKQLDRLRKFLAGTGLFPGRLVPQTSGSVKNLYHTAQMDHARGSSPAAQAVQTHNVTGSEIERTGRKSPVFLIWISLAGFGTLAGAGIFFYRRWYVR